MSFASEELAPEDVAAVVAAQFPQLATVSAELLGFGCDNRAFTVGGAWVFRFPRSDEVEQQLLREVALLRVLSRDSPLLVPEHTFLGEPSSQFPRHFVGYRKLPGVPGIQVDPVDVPFDEAAPQLAEFLSWLHTYPVAEAARLGVPVQSFATLIEAVCGEALEDLAVVRRALPNADLEGVHTYLARGVTSVADAASRPALVHNDFAAEHVLLDPQTHRIAGVIDWSDVAVSDPAIDFAGLHHWGGEMFVRKVLSCYSRPVDNELLLRARYLAACRGIADIVFGLQTSRAEYVAAGIRALQLTLPGL